MTHIDHTFVNAVPVKLAPNTLYISAKYEIVAHLCLCGCGSKVVTPLGPAEWTLTTDRHTVTLAPSIGNGALACRSHYLITNSIVHWLPQQSPTAQRRALERDDRDLQHQLLNDARWWRRIARTAGRWWRTRTWR
ncbi:hypothetical protein C8K30_104135 [Promicromonospora sp. AC04]|uniref:DUF6527 family protein n=1 Tax=Promicromonospora sp. AC04 TaxID=2135723 RepID=UPI000D3A39CB|nr:DUF6527 family protein [Promicromonospora sp. AC04]PUB27688.1 hypothetical protein C8K30_104135 [Promicromonospora sp. AC04]